LRTCRIAALLFFIFSFVLGCASLSASPIAVRYREGILHGFVVLSTVDGNPLAEGDLTQIPQGNRITSHLVLRFKDGSLQEETATFSQRSYFRLLHYHLVQKGPAFQRATETSIDCASGQVTVQYTDNDGKEKTASERMKLPPDLANGLVFILLKNLPENVSSTELQMVVATPKPRLVKLAVSSAGKDPFSLAGGPREALHYVIKVEIGGLAGLVAPLVGKQPPDGHIWILGGDAPTFVKSESIAYLGGPIWRIELVAPVWPKSATPESAPESPPESKNGSTSKQ
jgi:hypothetical protein